MPGQAIATFTLTDGSNGGTHVVWGFDEDPTFLPRAVGVFMNMENFLGPSFDKGLNSLKKTK